MKWQANRVTAMPLARPTRHYNSSDELSEIGPSKAKRLLESFGSPFGVASATIEDLQMVDGIGKSAGTKIHQVFHGL